MEDLKFNKKSSVPEGGKEKQNRVPTTLAYLLHPRKLLKQNVVKTPRRIHRASKKRFIS